MWATLLCLLSLVLALSSALYRILWRRRFGWGFATSTARVKGRVLTKAAPSGAERTVRSVELQTQPGQRLLVDLSGLPSEIGERLRVGLLVTVDGLPATLPAAEAHYRSPAGRRGLTAVRVVPGAWPELRWLNVLLVASVVLACWMSPRIFTRREQTALLCPPGTRYANDEHIEWCEADRKWRRVGTQDSIKHGPWRVWWEGDGARIRQTGQFVNGRPDGEWITWHRNGQIAERGSFVNGHKRGQWSRWSPDGEPRTSSFHPNIEP